jgi:Tfp pilus assembly protein PilZ
MATDPAGPDSWPERRRHERIPVDLPVRLSTIDPEMDPRTGRPYFRASREVVANLSPGGLFIKTRDPISPGRRVLIELHFPDGSPLEAVGRIAWSKRVLAPVGSGAEDDGVGVEILGAPPDQLATLNSFLGKDLSDEG